MPCEARLFFLAAENYYGDDTIITKALDDTTTINRLANISTFGYVIQKTPEQVPYWMGGSYETLWVSFIPRLFWPEKPTSTIGQEFGHRYALLDAADESTSVNLPWLPEFYANFGLFGVLVGMFAIGAMFRFLVQRFTAPRARRIDHVLGITITFTLFYAESNLALMVGGVFLNYLAFSILLRLVMMGSRRSS